MAVGSIPIARSINLVDSVALPLLWTRKRGQLAEFWTQLGPIPLSGYAVRPCPGEDFEWIQNGLSKLVSSDVSKLEGKRRVPFAASDAPLRSATPSGKTQAASFSW